MTAASQSNQAGAPDPESGNTAPLTATDVKFFEELQGLIAYIRSAKREIAALAPDEIREKHIRSATDELDAIVANTEQATGAILDSAEKIETIAKNLEVEPGMQLADAVTRIYEACNFQDITGQRISKVVTALKTIEGRVESLVKAVGGVAALPDGPQAASDDKELLNGPQLPGNAKTQDEIDALLKSFD
jgi:chemotaxis protein CheZ